MTGYTFNQLFDFTRTTSATFVGSNGLIQTTPASVNLLLYTQEFDNAAWTKSNATVTANSTTAPDGTTTADKLVENTANTSHYTNQSFSVSSGSTYTYSIYAKAAERNVLSIFSSGNLGGAACRVNLSDGSIQFGSPTVTNLGSGWYRISLQVSASSSGSAIMYNQLYNVTGTYTGDGTSGLFLWGAQFEAGSTATTYTRNNGGVYPARFDYDPVTLAPKGILIEEQRTNLIINSVFANSGAAAPTNFGQPIGTGTSAPAVSTLAPDVGSAYTQTATAQRPCIATTAAITLNASTTYIVSMLVESVTGTITPVDVIRCAIIPAGATITYPVCPANPTGAGSSPLETGRLLLSIAVSTTAGSSQMYFGLGCNGGVTGTIRFSCPQLELGAFATSYIPTVASQVTRTADVCSIVAPMFAPWYNQSEGTFVAEFSCASNSSVLSADDGTNSNFIRIGRLNLNGRLRVFSGGVEQADVGPANVAGWSGTVKEAATYKANDFAATVNGGVVSSDTSGSVPTVTQLRIGTSGLPDPINGHLRSIKFYPFRASNNQLQALTT